MLLFSMNSLMLEFSRWRSSPRLFCLGNHVPFERHKSRQFSCLLPHLREEKGRKPRASCFRLQTQTTGLRPMMSHKEESYLYYSWGWKDGRRELKEVSSFAFAYFGNLRLPWSQAPSWLRSIYLFPCSPCTSPNQENPSVASFSRKPPYWACNFNLVIKSQSVMPVTLEVDQITRTMCGDGW